MQCRKAIAAKTTKFHVTVIHPTRDRIRHFIDFGISTFLLDIVATTRYSNVDMHHEKYISF
jgi:hypothetical protein